MVSRRLGSFVFTVALVVSVALVGAACGSSSPHGNQPDANTSRADAGSTGGTVADFAECVPASTKPAEECKSDQSDCLADPAAGSTNPVFVCLPKCSTTSDCSIANFCVPAAGGTGGTAFGAIADHCYTAYCGQLANPAVMNGTTGAPCMVGAQTGENDIQGWCFPISDNKYGICLDSGTEIAGGTCDPNAGRGQATSLCDDTSICITSQNPPSNKCQSLCDPTTIATGDLTGGCKVPGEDCYDLSTMETIGGSVITATVGFCDATHTACDVTKTGGCDALSVTGDAWGCESTTAVRSDGVCSPYFAGSIAVGQPCDLTMLTTGDATQCVEGAMCYQDPDATTGTCYQVCSLQTGGTPCATGTCTNVTVDAGADGQLGTADDQVSQTWGLCK